MMVFNIQFGVGTGLIEAVETNRLIFQLWKLGKAVSIRIPGRTIAVLPIDISSHLIVRRYPREVEGRIVIIRSRSVQIRNRMSKGTGIANGLFRYDIDCSGDSRRTEQSRSSAPYHFDPFDHIGRNLFQSVHASQCGEDRTGINQYLCIFSFHTVDADLRVTTVLAIVFDPDARLENQPLC